MTKRKSPVIVDMTIDDSSNDEQMCPLVESSDEQPTGRHDGDEPDDNTDDDDNDAFEQFMKSGFKASRARDTKMRRQGDKLRKQMTQLVAEMSNIVTELNPQAAHQTKLAGTGDPDMKPAPTPRPLPQTTDDTYHLTPLQQKYLQDELEHQRDEMRIDLVDIANYYPYHNRVDLVEIGSDSNSTLGQELISRNANVERWSRQEINLATEEGFQEAARRLREVRPHHLVLTLRSFPFRRRNRPQAIR